MLHFWSSFALAWEWTPIPLCLSVRILFTLVLVRILKKQVSISNFVTDTIRPLPNHCWWSVLKIKWVYLLLALDILLMRLKDALLRHSLNPDPCTLLAAVASQYIHNVPLIITEKAITTVFHHPASYSYIQHPWLHKHMIHLDVINGCSWTTMELLIAER